MQVNSTPPYIIICGSLAHWGGYAYPSLTHKVNMMGTNMHDNSLGFPINIVKVVPGFIIGNGSVFPSSFTRHVQNDVE